QHGGILAAGDVGLALLAAEVEHLVVSGHRALAAAATGQDRRAVAASADHAFAAGADLLGINLETALGLDVGDALALDSHVIVLRPLLLKQPNHHHRQQHADDGDA